MADYPNNGNQNAEAGEIRICENCGVLIKAGSVFCTLCGTKIEAAPKNTCRSCGAALKISDVFCSQCGTRTGTAAKNVCPNCRLEVSPGMMFCTRCGVRLPGQPAPMPAAPRPAPVPNPVPAPPVPPPAPSPIRTQMRNIAISRASQVVCATNSYMVIVGGLPLGNISAGQTIYAPVGEEIATVEIICTTVMVNKKLRLKLRLGANPAVSFTVQWPGDILATVQDAQILEQSN